MRRLLAAMLAATVVCGPVPMTAWAQEDVTQTVEELSGQAAAAYRDGDFARAIELFKQAYDLQAVPNLLFNIAKVYEKTEDWDNAIKYYREFIKAPDADSKAREVALERIDTLEQVKTAEEEAEQKALAEKQAEEQKKLDEQEKVDEQQQEEEESSGNPVAWITLTGGAGLLAGGLVFGLLATSEQSKFEGTSDVEAKRAARKSGKTFALVADSMFAAGAIATTVGIILFATSGDSESDPEATATLPFGWVGPNGEAGVGLSVDF